MEVGEDSRQQELEGQQRLKPRNPVGTQEVNKLLPTVAMVTGLSEPHALAPAQAGGVVLLDVALQVSPDGDVRLDPVHVDLVPAESRAKVTR